jgi:hypothetical protein
VAELSLVRLIATAIICLLCPAAKALDDYTITGKVFQKTKDGMLVDCTIKSSSISNPTVRHDIVFLAGYPDSSKLFDGSPVRCRVSDNGTREYTDVLGCPSYGAGLYIFIDAAWVEQRLRFNQSIQPTAGRRTAKFFMTPTSHPATTRVLASGG